MSLWRALKPSSKTTLLIGGWAILVVLASFPASPARADDYDRICGDAARAKATSFPEQKRSYCKAAKEAKNAAGTHRTLMGVWGGVAAVCTVACLNPGALYGAHLPAVCMGSSAAVSVTDAVMTKNYVSAISGLAGPAAGLLLNGTDKAATQAAPKAINLNLGACLSAATATFSAFMKYRSAQSEDSSYQQNLTSARDVESSAATVSGSLSASSSSGGGVKSSSATTQAATPPSVISSSSGGSSSVSSSSGCSSAQSGGASGSAAAVQCAAALDPTLPSAVRSAQFQNDFRTVSGGMELGDFVAQQARSDSPSGAMVSAMSGALDAATQSRLGVLMSSYQSRVLQGGVSGTEYAQGGGGGGGTQSPALSPEELMQGILKQLKPTQKEEDRMDPQVKAVIFAANRTRNPASLAEDSSLNLFARVTYRYRQTGLDSPLKSQ